MLAVIQVRFNSQRLPGKALRMLGNKNLLERTINRLKQSEKITTVVVATSSEKTDDPIAEHAQEIGTEIYRGDLEDVGNRLLNGAKSMGSDSFVRISGDSPFIDWRLVDQAIELHNISEADLVSNIFPRSYPKGQSVEIISTASLAKLCKSYRTNEEKEHVTPYFYKNYNKFCIVSFTSGHNRSNSIHCIDDQTDFETAEKVVRDSGNDDLSWQELELLFSKHRKTIEG